MHQAVSRYLTARRQRLAHKPPDLETLETRILMAGDLSISPIARQFCADDQALQIHASFSDLDPGTSYQATVNWGDNQQSVATVDVATMQIAASHQYAADGEYTPTVSLARGSETAQRAFPATVFNPGLVTTQLLPADPDNPGVSEYLVTMPGAGGATHTYEVAIDGSGPTARRSIVELDADGQPIAGTARTIGVGGSTQGSTSQRTRSGGQAENSTVTSLANITPLVPDVNAAIISGTDGDDTFLVRLDADTHNDAYQALAAGDYVNVEPLIAKLEQNLRCSIVAATVAKNSFVFKGVSYFNGTGGQAATVTPDLLKGIYNKEVVQHVDCRGLCLLVMLKGLLDNLSDNEFSAVYGMFSTKVSFDANDNPLILQSNVALLSQTLPGDWLIFKNDPRYTNPGFHSGGDLENENVIKVLSPLPILGWPSGKGLYYGIPSSGPRIRPYSGVSWSWTQELIDGFNSPPVTRDRYIATVPGYVGDDLFFNMPALAKKILTVRVIESRP